MFSKILPLLTLASAVVAKIIPIQVGNGALDFKPNTTAAAIGDVLEFHFYSYAAPHSVVEGVFSAPCTPAQGAFFSNYINGTTSGNETYSITVTSTDPIWYYCSARKHCESGMVGVVNPPSNLTIASYAVSAKNAASNVAPASTEVSGSYVTQSTTITTGSASPTGASTTGASGISEPSGTSSAGAASTNNGAMQSAGVMGLMAAGGLAALMA